MLFEVTFEIEDRGGNKTTKSLSKESVTIGRNEDNDIVTTRNLNGDFKHPRPKGYMNTGRHHGLIQCVDGKLTLYDAGTSNGLHCLNEELVNPCGGYQMKVGDRYYVGDYKITLISFVVPSSNADNS